MRFLVFLSLSFLPFVFLTASPNDTSQPQVNLFDRLRFAFSFQKREKTFIQYLDKQDYKGARGYLKEHPVWNKETVLWNRISVGDIQGVKLLLEFPLELNSLPYVYKSVEQGEFEIARIIFEAAAKRKGFDFGKSVLLRKSEEGVPPLVEVASRISSQNVDSEEVKWLKFFVNKGADVNEKDSLGTTALMKISRGVYSQEAQRALIFLLKNGARISEADIEGKVALHESHFDLAKILIKHGAKPTIRDNKGQTPSHIFALAGNKEAVDYLSKISRKTLSMKDQFGKTPQDYLRGYQMTNFHEEPGDVRVPSSIPSKSKKNVEEEVDEDISFDDFY